MDTAGKLSFLHNFRGRVAGTDEAGRGPLAGPVVAAAVVLTASQKEDLLKQGLKDSKKLTPGRRERLFLSLCALEVEWKAQAASVSRIAALNISQASLWAMGQAVRKLPRAPDLVVVDGLYPIPHLPAQLPLVRADDQVPEVAAASVIAKVLRDRVMMVLDRLYPGYGLARHKGYPTREHRERVRALGLSPAHRPGFCAKLLQEGWGQDDERSRPWHR